jgi:hypothetical protein
LNPSVNDRATKWAVAGLFLFLYVPFLYQHGYLKAFIGHGDFPTIYWGAQLAFNEGQSPYVNGAFAGAEARQGQRLFPYLYPPPSLLAFYPFAHVSYDTAKLILLVASHLSFAGALYLLFFKIFRTAPPLAFRGLAALLVCVYVLTFWPVVDNLVWGQINLPVLLMLCLSWWAVKRNSHWLWVALPLSLAILLKTYPLLLLPLLVFRRRYGAAAAAAGLCALYALASWLVLPRGLWGDWLTNVAPTGGYGLRPFNLFLPGAPWNHSVNGFFIFLGDRCPNLLWLDGPRLTRALTYVVCAAVAALTLWLSYLCSRVRGEGKWVDYEFALFLQMMFLVAPLSWEHHFVYVLPAALISIRLLLDGRGPRGARALLFAALCVAAWDFPRDNMFHYNGVWAAVIPVKFYAAFALWACFAWTLWAALRERREETFNASAQVFVKL